VFSFTMKQLQQISKARFKSVWLAHRLQLL
jgi:hypothetical protein